MLRALILAVLLSGCAAIQNQYQGQPDQQPIIIPVIDWDF